MKHAARENLKEYAVWDRTTRWFHWINFAAVSGLAGIGTVILYANALGIGDNGKVALKAVHVLTGYVFCLNLPLEDRMGLHRQPLRQMGSGAAVREGLPARSQGISRRVQPGRRSGLAWT